MESIGPWLNLIKQLPEQPGIEAAHNIQVHFLAQVSRIMERVDGKGNRRMA
jgi:hypothetical protein